MSNDPLGDRMKLFERRHDTRLMPQLPIVIRLDGRGFSTWTRRRKRPYDERLSLLMIDLTRALVIETQAAVGYTQSDEISLVIIPKTYADTKNPNKSQVYFDARHQKIVSVTASFAGAFFNREVPQRIPEKATKLAAFDCRAFEMPSAPEAANALLWREIDATKNSLQMAARTVCSHSEMQGRPPSWMHEQLHARGLNWDSMDDGFKRGTFVRRRLIEKSPGVFRPLIEPEVLPPLAKISNLPDVLFKAAEPVMRGARQEPSCSVDGWA